MLRWGYNNDLHSNYAILSKLSAKADISAHQKVKDKYLEPEELDKLLERLKAVPYWYYLSYFLSLTGLRIGEALALHKNDIGSKYITVNKTLDLNDGTFGTPKTLESNREVFIQPELRSLIKKINIYEKEKSMSLNLKSILFMFDDKGNPLSYYAFRKYIYDAAKDIGIAKKVTPHIFRHTHASLLASQGVSIEAISRRLGHSDSDITKEIYLHVTKQLIKNDEAQINNVKLL